MIVKEIRDEDFTSYKKSSMVIGFPSCTFKCERDCGQKICQNSALVHAPDIEVSIEQIIQRYLNNPITKAIIMAGLEPFDSASDLLNLIKHIRMYTNDDIVIYTGYKKEEVKYMTFKTHWSGGRLEWSYLERISQYPNIIIKFGRFIPGQQPHYDEVLGINLASDNQYAERIS